MAKSFSGDVAQNIAAGVVAAYAVPVIKRFIDSFIAEWKRQQEPQDWE